MEPNDLARELGITGKTLRSWLRRTFPRSSVDDGARWTLTADQVAAARRHFDGAGSTATPITKARPPAPAPAPSEGNRFGGRSDSDEAYVIDLIDEIVSETGIRQHRFDWLLGDPGSGGRRVRLPVDAYYPSRGLVVEYRERQHDEPVPHFDKPDRLTVSGVHRGEQRRRYDRLREQEIPAHGLRLVVVRPSDLAANAAGRLLRRREQDLAALRALLDG